MTLVVVSSMSCYKVHLTYHKNRLDKSLIEIDPLSKVGCRCHNIHDLSEEKFSFYYLHTR